MSHTLSLKNYNKTAQAVAKGQPDYIITSSDDFPTPDDDDATGNMLLRVSDTGYEYEWTGAAWALTYRPHDDREPVTSKFFQLVASTTLASAATSQDTTIEVSDATDIVVGYYISFGGSSALRSPVEVIAISDTTITISRPLDLGYDADESLAILTADMNVTGTLASSQSFSIIPPAGNTWAINNLILSLVHTTAGDSGLFGDQDALTYGVLFRVYKDGSYNTHTNWKTSGDMALDMYDVRFDTRSSGGGSYGTTAQINLTDKASPIVINGDNGDYLEILVQDDLSGLTSFQARCSGYHVEDTLVTPDA